MHLALLGLVRGLALPRTFSGWAAEAGIVAPKLRILNDAIDSDSTVRSCVAAAPIEKEEELCVLPRSRCLDLSRVTSGTPCPEMAPPALWDSLEWYEALAVWLLSERRRGEASPIHGYVQYLPQPVEFSDAPLEWSEAELAELRYPPIAIAIEEQAAAQAALYARLRREGGPEAASVTAEELRWAQQCVLSRAFSSVTQGVRRGAKGFKKKPTKEVKKQQKKVDEAKSGLLRAVGLDKFFEKDEEAEEAAAPKAREMALMPMLDALNHASDAKSSTRCRWDAGREAFVLVASEPVRQGAQVLLSYGDKGNDELLQLFGFVENENPHDTFVPIGLDAHVGSLERNFASEAEMRRRFGRLEKLGLGDALTLELRADGKLPPRMLHALRILFGSAAELDDEKALKKPASIETEQRVWAALRSYCKLARNAMGGPLKADLSALDRERDPRRRLAIQFRAEKKRILATVEQKVAMLERNRKL